VDIRNYFKYKYPYVDLSDQNIDWLLDGYQVLFDRMDEIEKKFSQIEVLTPEQIQSLIDASVSANNQVIGNMIDASAGSLRADYMARIASQRTELLGAIDIAITAAIRNAHAYSDSKLIEAKHYADSLIRDVGYMYDPITGEYSPIPDVINNVVYTFHGDDMMTAGEYDSKNLTAEAYDALRITAIDYDFRAKQYIN
jgi:hypothetical protein